MKAVRIILEDAPIWIAIFILASSIYFFLYGWGFARLPVYWLHIIFGTQTPRLALFLIPLLFVLLLLWIRVVPAGDKRSVYIAVGIMMFVANALMCAAVPSMILGRIIHRDSTWLNGHRYYSSSDWKVGVGGTHPTAFYMYECDTVGLICILIYREDAHGTPLEEYESMTAILIPDPIENTISIQIDGEIVYTHHP